MRRLAARASLLTIVYLAHLAVRAASHQRDGIGRVRAGHVSDSAGAELRESVGAVVSAPLQGAPSTTAGGTLCAPLPNTLSADQPGVVCGPAVSPRARVWAAATSLRAALLLASCGVLLVSVAYAAGRSGRPWAEAAFWCGDLLVFLPLAIRVFRPGAERRAIPVLAQAAFQSFVGWMYSPVLFKFPDELQHRRTAEDILQLHTLFHPSAALPISPRFPGLEEITTALISVTHLGVFPAGLIVVGLAHVGLSAAVYLLLKGIAHDGRIAGVAALLFATNPHNAFFNAMFLYEAPALLFMAVALLMATRERFRAGRELPLAVLSIAAVCVTHHVTAAVTALALLTLGVLVSLQGGFRSRGARLLGLGVLGALFLGGWVIGVAPMTYAYLSGPVGNVIAGFLREGSVQGKDGIGASVSPMWTATTMIGTGVMAILVTSGCVLTWRRSTGPVLRAFVLLGLTFFAMIGIRVLAANGADLSGRLLTYVYVFAGTAAAVALVALWEPGHRWRAALAVVAITLVFAGNVTSGWPAPYELVPGRFHVDGFESGVDPADTQAARWIANHAPADSTVACDFTLCSLVGGYGTQRVLDNVPELFFADAVGRSVRALLAREGIDYVVVDRRMSSQRPVTGSYFEQETPDQLRTVRLPLGSLEKFNGVPRVSRVYDNGPIAIYGVRRLWDG